MDLISQGAEAVMPCLVLALDFVVSCLNFDVSYLVLYTPHNNTHLPFPQKVFKLCFLGKPAVMKERIKKTVYPNPHPHPTHIPSYPYPYPYIYIYIYIYRLG